jgi:hypothetical protein
MLRYQFQVADGGYRLELEEVPIHTSIESSISKTFSKPTITWVRAGSWARS